MLWLIRTATLVPEVRRMRPFGFGLGHTRIIVVLVAVVVAVVFASISRRNGR